MSESEFESLPAGLLTNGYINHGLWELGKIARITLITHGLQGVTLRCSRRTGYYDIHKYRPGQVIQVTKEKLV